MMKHVVAVVLLVSLGFAIVGGCSSEKRDFKSGGGAAGGEIAGAAGAEPSGSTAGATAGEGGRTVHQTGGADDSGGMGGDDNAAGAMGTAGTRGDGTCTGECIDATDCCQFPVALQSPGIKSCEDIAAAINLNTIDCSTPSTPTAKTLCFEQATYCDCGATTWSCSDTNNCVYEAKCLVGRGTDVPSGCPTFSRRENLALKGLTCNPNTLTCTGTGTGAEGSCTGDDTCEGKRVVDVAPADLCTAGECTCYTANKRCYRKCGRDIDCGTGFVCDTEKSVCLSSYSCELGSECPAPVGALRPFCVATIGRPASAITH